MIVSSLLKPAVSILATLVVAGCALPEPDFSARGIDKPKLSNMKALCPVGVQYDRPAASDSLWSWPKRGGRIDGCSLGQLPGMLFGTYEPSPAQTEKVRRFLIAMGFTEQTRSARSLDPAGPQFELYMGASINDQTQPHYRIQLTVRYGDEALWYSVLKDSNLFSDLGSAPFYLAMSTGSAVVSDIRHPGFSIMRANPSSSVQVHTRRVSVNDVEEWLLKNFKGKADLAVIQNIDPLLRVEFTSMRKQIFEKDNYWEAADMQVVKVDGVDRATLYFALSVRFATGIGSNRPSEQSYLSTVPEQDREVQRYLSRICTTIKSDLESRK